MNLKDEYVDGQGVVYRPKLVTESHCFLRADHFGRIFLRMCPVDQETGELKFNRSSYGFKEAKHNPEIWMQQNSEEMPKRYVCSATQKALDEHGVCTDCTEQELREFNLKRLADSKQAILDSEEARRLEQEGGQS